MSVNGFNPFDLVTDLKEAGFPQNQAEVLARALTIIESKNAATKQDLELSTAELKRDIETVRSELKRDIKDLDVKIETIKNELKKDIRELENKIALKMTIHSGGVIITLLSCLVTLAKLGLLRP